MADIKYVEGRYTFPVAPAVPVGAAVFGDCETVSGSDVEMAFTLVGAVHSVDMGAWRFEEPEYFDDSGRLTRDGLLAVVRYWADEPENACDSAIGENPDDVARRDPELGRLLAASARARGAITEYCRRVLDREGR